MTGRMTPGVAGIALSLLAATVFIMGAGQATRAAEPILIGVSAPLSGDNAGSGQESLNSAKLAVEQINAKGGVLGRPLQIVEGDDRCDPKESAIVAQKFVAQKINAAASHYCSGAALAALPIFREAGILYANWGAASAKVPAAGYDKLFNTIFSGAAPGPFAATFAIEKLHKKTFAMVDDRTPANGEFTVGFQKKATALGGKVVLFDHVTQGDKDFSAFVTNVKGSGADALYASLYYAEAGLLTRQLRDQQVDITVICTDASLDPQYLQIAGAAAEGVYGVTQPQATELATAKEFVADYNKKYGKDPGYIGAYAYDAVQVIAEGYTGAGKVDNDAAAKWLHGRTKETALKGITGPLYWNADGTVPDFTFSVYQVKNGKFQFVQP
jgi:branched-chain amino acid transport system substrate-binding protein